MDNIESYVSVIGRVLIAACFLGFGYTKLFVFGPHGTAQYLGSVFHAPTPLMATWIAIAVEVLGGLAILVGLKTRWVAAVLAIWCLFTGFGFHLPIGDPANMSDFYKNLAMARGLLYVAAYGPGPMSIDASMATDKT